MDRPVQYKVHICDSVLTEETETLWANPRLQSFLQHFLQLLVEVLELPRSPHGKVSPQHCWKMSKSDTFIDQSDTARDLDEEYV